jgi:hypothetical protein
MGFGFSKFMHLYWFRLYTGGGGGWGSNDLDLKGLSREIDFNNVDKN